MDYEGAHTRVKRAKGKAREHKCFAGCGKTAMDWAYLHGDPNEAEDRKGRKYSMDPKFYVPMCRACHQKFDKEFRASGGGTGVVIPSAP